MARENHQQTVDPHAATGRWREAVLERAHVLLVVGVGGIVVVGAALLTLLDEALVLLDGIVDLRVAADQLDAADHGVEVLGKPGVAGVALVIGKDSSGKSYTCVGWLSVGSTSFE